MGRIIIPLYYCKSKVPLVLFRSVLGEKRIGFIDTGSEVSMFDPSLMVEGFKSVKSSGETNFVGVNGEGESTKVELIKGDVVFWAKDGERHAVETVGVTYDFSALTDAFRRKTGKDISISAIFGSDFLKHYRAKIDFKDNTLSIETD